MTEAQAYNRRHHGDLLIALEPLRWSHVAREILTLHDMGRMLTGPVVSRGRALLETLERKERRA